MYDPKKSEPEMQKFWREKQIYEKLKKKNSNGKPFYMMDGPPYANGDIHMGHALNKILKDIAMRSRRMQGYNVFDRPGYDTHGVPIEYQVEKEIGSKSKKDIEKYGVKRFIEKCKEFATKYIEAMNQQFEDLGVWMDFKDPYLTLDKEYIETIWDTFKEADKKGLLYLGKYPVHICPRCETAVAYNEIEYEKQDDTSIYVKFPLKDEKNKFFVIWTTTPWTLPGNTGIMVNPDIEYVEAELSNGEIWIIAKDRIEELMSATERGYTIKKILKGKELEGIEYINPLADKLKLTVKNGYRVVLSSRYVNVEDGSGLVHCAPGHGKEDYEVGKEYGLDMPSPVAVNGILTEEAGKYSGKKARVVDAEIIEDLEKEGFLVYKHKYTHDYPLCWRCKSALLMVSMPQWFFSIKDIHQKLLDSNEKVNWIPKYMKLRMKAWLEGISDWPISRNRYWGTPLPIWVCEECSEKEVIGSIKELEEKSGVKVTEVHKPEIDDIFLKCQCGGKMKRVSEVLDVWFDSGVASWAALHSEEEMNKFWPADLNIEGKDQIRGWWNSQLILSEIKFGKLPYKNIMVHGMVLDLGKKKMSKSKGNVISPQDVINSYSRDLMRYYFAKTSKGEDFAFDENEFKRIKQIFIVLENVINYERTLNPSEKGELKTEDKWILSRFNSVLENIINSYNNFNFQKVLENYERFLLEDFSRTYIKIIRERENEEIIRNIINSINFGLIALISPVCPFITEYIYQNSFRNSSETSNKGNKEESIHLCSMPVSDKSVIDKELESKFAVILKAIEEGLSERDKQKIGLRWPLRKAIVYVGKDIANVKELEEFGYIIKSQLNVKEVEFKTAENANEISVELDTELTSELEAEGFARELSRKVQAFRKKLSLQKHQKIKLLVFTDDSELRDMLETHKDFIQERTNAASFEIVDNESKIDEENFKNKESFKIKDKRGIIAINNYQ